MASNTIPAFYQQRSSADNERESDDDDEEQLVLVELTGIIDADILEKCNNKCKILGINTEKPFLQVDKYVFAGEYEDALGTSVIFEEIPDEDDVSDQRNSGDSAEQKKEQCDGESTKPKLKYKCHTVKKLNMTRTFLTEKKEGDEGGGKIEWFQIKDSSACWPHMICSFAQENEDAGGSQSDEDDHGQLDVSNDETGQTEQGIYSDGKPHSSDSAKGPCESEGRMHLDCENEDRNLNKPILAAEEETPSAVDSSSTQDGLIHHDQTS